MNASSPLRNAQLTHKKKFIQSSFLLEITIGINLLKNDR